MHGVLVTSVASRPEESSSSTCCGVLILGCSLKPGPGETNLLFTCARPTVVHHSNRVISHAQLEYCSRHDKNGRADPLRCSKSPPPHTPLGPPSMHLSHTGQQNVCCTQKWQALGPQTLLLTAIRFIWIAAVHTVCSAIIIVCPSWLAYQPADWNVSSITCRTGFKPATCYVAVCGVPDVYR
jgi:hypothetical protein